jgi:hypothetical protein
VVLVVLLGGGSEGASHCGSDVRVCGCNGDNGGSDVGSNGGSDGELGGTMMGMAVMVGLWSS